MGWPQVVMIFLLGCDFTIDLIKHGEPKEGKYNVWTAMVAVALNAYILYKGGFWG